MKKVLTIAGSDCSGGAGVQADLKTMAAHGVFGMSVIVSVVAENTARVIDIQDISPRMIEEQIDAVFEDIAPDAVKIGMLSSPECMTAVADKLRQYRPANVVIDPVMFAKNGDPLMDPKSVGALIETVLPFADVLTPNVPEAQYLAGMEIHTPADMETAARKIGALGCKNVLPSYRDRADRQYLDARHGLHAVLCHRVQPRTRQKRARGSPPREGVCHRCNPSRARSRTRLRTARPFLPYF